VAFSAAVRGTIDPTYVVAFERTNEPTERSSICSAIVQSIATTELAAFCYA
jgi:hypothetical protein